MKQVILKKVRLKTTQLANQDLSYKTIFLEMVERFPEGVLASQMGDAIAIARKLHDAQEDGSIFLENSEHSYLCQRFDQYRFSVAAEEIVEMRGALFNAQEVSTPHLTSVKKKA